jgi:hypothetical protein
MDSSGEAQQSQSGEHASSSFAINITHIPFSRRNPSVWFKQLEAHFKMHNLRSERTMFYAAFSSLPGDIIADVDIEGESYCALKKVVLSQNSKSKTEQIEEALGQCTLGDQKPSLFIRSARKKLEDIGLTPTDEILKTRLLNALPHDGKVALTGHQTLPIDQFAAVADSIYKI